ncbi:efflux pump antibiotic resistance protein, putative [Talaromyces stipitatus ATCC 10500]|uniref:Efflux pump antibiotic resistance protein, putative n=1 Tax=Talaromyces stipitatus (strain ATCC 10500 / CBS 375.48 / QM 6759 / NRRL 1006) TaxID=441959 RepID=B8M7W2_TALSN|nr:efflux pump antibiotic resistance protein, putative [Talaromyces stipitatus ATCC 10500]EED19841.1 efflux pump antibiotic resistance protein, putative [Talaromyces stipitatus ATCC 10500]
MSSTEDVKEVVQSDSSNDSGEDIEKSPRLSPTTSLQPNNDSPRPVHGFKWVLVCASLYIGALIYGLDTTIAADIQAAIVERFNNVERLTWVGTAFPLGSVCAILPVSAFYHNFDLKPLFVGSILLFEIGSALCGAAPNMDALIVGRVIAGLGGSGIFLGTLNFFSLLTSDKERGRYISGIGVVWGTGAVLGPVVGGAFSTSSATWRWAFYINLVIAAVCAPAYIFYLPSVKPPGAPDTSVFARLRNLDWIGFIGGTGAMLSFVMALTFAGSIWAWNDGRTITTFVVAGVLLILVLLQQYFVLFTNRPARMFPPRHILKDSTLILLNIVTAAGATNIYVPVYYIPVYCSFVHGDSALMAAVRLLPYICFLASMNMLSGAFLPRISYYWALYLFGGILMTIGGATLYTVDIDTRMANVYGYSVLLGAGTGLIFQAGYTVGGVKTMMRTGSGLDVQRVISMLNLSQLGFQMGSLLIGGQIFQSLAMKNLTRVLHGLDFSQEDIRSAVAGTQSTLFASLTPSMKSQAISAIIDAISKVYTISIAAGGITVICALLMKKERLFKTAAPDMVVAGGA